MKQVGSGREQGSDGRLDAQALFRAHAPFVASFLHRLGTPRADVDDLVQEVFLVAHRKGGFLPGAAQPRTWLAAIAVRIARGSHRARGRRREASDEAALRLAGAATVGGADPAETLDTRRSLARVQRALDALDIEHRAAFVLYEIEGESCDSIASSFEVPVGTVYSRLHHARKRFLDAYDALAEGAEREPAQRTRVAEGT
jgi:RNA polymerase sigma-70 factor (ECF subfamily)